MGHEERALQPVPADGQGDHGLTDWDLAAASVEAAKEHFTNLRETEGLHPALNWFNQHVYAWHRAFTNRVEGQFAWTIGKAMDGKTHTFAIPQDTAATKRTRDRARKNASAPMLESDERQSLALLHATRWPNSDPEPLVTDRSIRNWITRLENTEPKILIVDRGPDGKGRKQSESEPNPGARKPNLYTVNFGAVLIEGQTVAWDFMSMCPVCDRLSAGLSAGDSAGDSAGLSSYLTATSDGSIQGLARSSRDQDHLLPENREPRPESQGRGSGQRPSGENQAPDLPESRAEISPDQRSAGENPQRAWGPSPENLVMARRLGMGDALDLDLDLERRASPGRGMRGGDFDPLASLGIRRPARLAAEEDEDERGARRRAAQGDGPIRRFWFGRDGDGDPYFTLVTKRSKWISDEGQVELTRKQSDVVFSDDWDARERLYDWCLSYGDRIECRAYLEPCFKEDSKGNTVPRHRVTFEKPGGYLDELVTVPVSHDERREYLRLMGFGIGAAGAGSKSGYDLANEMSHAWFLGAR